MGLKLFVILVSVGTCLFKTEHGRSIKDAHSIMLALAAKTLIINNYFDIDESYAGQRTVVCNMWIAVSIVR